MARRGRPPGTRFGPLIAYLRTQAANTVPLTLDEIGALVGRQMPVTAYVHSGYWYSRNRPLTRELHAAGWRARLDVKARSVTFTRLSEGESWRAD